MNREITGVELMRPRYKVIADWPNSIFRVGQILRETFADEEWECKDFPHLFKKLEWWEERKLEEMPSYVKQTDMVDSLGNNIPDWFLKVKKHFNAGNGEWRDDSYNVFCAEKDHRTIGTNMNYSRFIPATEEEYNNSLQTNKKG